MQPRIAEIRFHSESAKAPDAAWSRSLDDALANGFNAVLVSDAGARSVLPALASACDARGLALWIAVALDAAGLPHYATRALARLDPWLVDSEDALDPRRPPRQARPGPVDPSDALEDAWRSELDSLAAAGVAGVVCRDPDRLPPAFWRSLLATTRRTLRPVAWTPGLPHAAIRALIESGFDGVCGSLAWWDGKSAWLIDERERQRGAMQLAFPIDPFSTDTRERKPPSTDDRARGLAGLWTGAVVGDALLVPAAMRDVASATDIRAVNGWLAGEADGGERFKPSDAVRILSGPDAPITAIVRANAPDLRAADRVVVVLVNPAARDAAANAAPHATAGAAREFSMNAAMNAAVNPTMSAAMNASMSAAIVTSALSGFGDFKVVASTSPGASASGLDPCATLRLAPGEARVLEGRRLAATGPDVERGKRPADAATKAAADAAVLAAVAAPRIAIESVTPSIDDGRFPVKRSAGEAVRVEADLLIDGHEKLAAALRYRALGDRDWNEVRMEAIGNDRYAASFPLLRIGRHEFAIEAWRDGFATYRNELDKKSAAGLDVALEVEEGRLHVADALAHAKTLKRADVVKRLGALSQSLAESTSATTSTMPAATMAARVASLLASQTLADMQAADARPFATRTEAPFPVDAERSAASFASWYELFPRSQGNGLGVAVRHGTFDDVIARLPAVRAMGFDVFYFTPIHPIGKKNRKGRNNSLTAGDDDPGSPYAIGSADGGHDALHSELGTFEDFERMREAAIESGLELALDFAIQCSPDHPWLKDHPGWFAWRPDGSLRYAENPPKKYEDIVNVDFYGRADADSDAGALWLALRDVILLWVEHGVRIFRVDNPHTKPLPFWEWMIGDIRARYPDVIFLSEAFTRPKVMYRLAKVGFSQSYTYFTWRHTKQEFIDYLTELTADATADLEAGSRGGTKRAVPRDFFRPHFFVNTPDINPVFLQRSGRAGFLIRAALASTLSGLWGIYSGFELCEAMPVPGKEEYQDSEKYEIRAWDWQRPGNIVAEITALNRIRTQNPALHTHLNVRFQNAFDPNILYFEKSTEDRSNIVLVAINLDPHGAHEADFEVPLWAWGLPDDATVGVTDLLSGHRFAWQGKIQHLRLDPILNPYAIWRVTP